MKAEGLIQGTPGLSLALRIILDSERRNVLLGAFLRATAAALQLAKCVGANCLILECLPRGGAWPRGTCSPISLGLMMSW